MNIPIELFSLFIGASIALGLFGFLRNPQVPALMTFGGIFILFIAVTTDNIIMDWFINDNSQLVMAYDVDSRSFERSIINNTALIVGEYVDGSSGQLIGDTINCMETMLRTTGSPNISQPIIFGVFNTDGQLKHSFGSFNVTNINTSATWYKLCTYNNPYTIVTNDRFGVMHSGSTAGNSIVIQYDASNPFDGTITVHSEYNQATNTWTNFNNNDMTAKLYFENLDTPTINNANFEFTEMPKVIFSLLGAIFMLSGALMVFKGQS